MLFSKMLETATNDFHGEQWEHLSNGILNSFENCELSFKRKNTILVKDTAENVLPLNDGDDLLNQVLGSPIEHHLKEFGVVV